MTAAATSRYRCGSSVRDGSSENAIRIPGIPAWVKNRAHTDHRYAAVTPTEISVSIVAAPWRRFVSAARWNGQAPHTTTGEARVNASHCQWSNCRAGTIDSSITGRLSPAETSRRCRHGADSSGSGSAASAAGRGRGSVAVYPVASTAAMSSSGVTSSGNSTVACSVARLTLARTPSMRLSRFSTRAAHEAQVIPPMCSVTVFVTASLTVRGGLRSAGGVVAAVLDRRRDRGRIRVPGHGHGAGVEIDVDPGHAGQRRHRPGDRRDAVPAAHPCHLQNQTHTRDYTPRGYGFGAGDGQDLK